VGFDTYLPWPPFHFNFLKIAWTWISFFILLSIKGTPFRTLINERIFNYSTTISTNKFTTLIIPYEMGRATLWTSSYKLFFRSLCHHITHIFRYELSTNAKGITHL